jgi:rubredoxin
MLKASVLAGVLSLTFWLLTTTLAFHSPVASFTRSTQFRTRQSMSDPMNQQQQQQLDPMEEAMMDDATLAAMAKARRAQELRAQEVFMKKSTGKHKCSNCDWEYDEAKGDAMMIGGMIQPGTTFEVLPNNWRCPVCRASKDSFAEVVEEIPGFAVNQGYGFGANAWTAGQKNVRIRSILNF